MTQANRVYSTPPTNTPVDPTRRRFVTVAAGASIISVGSLTAAEGINLSASTINVLAPKTPSKEITPSHGIEGDPVFGLIADKLAADVAHCEAIDAQGEIEGRGDFSSDEAIEAQDNCEAACHYVNEVDWRLANTPPTTLAGVAAVLRFANEIEDAGLEWPHTDTIGPDGWHYQLRATMAAAIEALIRKAVQS